MGPIKHLKYSIALAAGLGITSKKWGVALGGFASGVLVDVDHLIEYGSYCKDSRITWDWEEFFSGAYFNKKRTTKVIFHSWEAAILMWMAVWMTHGVRRKNILYGIASGYTLHLTLDEIGNNLNHLGYFELYRYLVGWKQEKLL